MYISCYQSDEINFNHNGLFKISVNEDGENNIYRVLNGQFYCTIEISKSDYFFNYIKKRMIVKLPTPNKKNRLQLFRLFDYVDEGDSLVWTGYHIAWDLITGHIKHINMINMTRKEASEYILDKAKEFKSHRFTVTEMQMNDERKNLQIVRKNPLAALLGSESNTVLNRFSNTEFDFDNFQIKIYNQLGEDTGFLIKEDKNIIKYRKEFESKNIITRLIVQGANELLLPEYYIDSPKINDYDEIFYGHVILSDIGVDEENGITEEIAINLLRKAGYDLFEKSHIDEEILSWTITFDDGQDNERIPYQLRQLLKLDLGDTVNVNIRESNNLIKSRILEYNYNFVTEKFVDITISSVSQTFTSNVDNDIGAINEKVDLLSYNTLANTNKINDSLDQNNFDLENVKARLNELSQKVDSFDDEFESNTQDIEALLDLVADLEDIIGGTSDDLVSVQQRIKIINESIVKLGLRLDDVESKIEDVKLELEDNSDKIINYEQRLVLVEQKIEEIINSKVPSE